MTEEKDFWFGKRVLVTGGDGFVASHLINRLIENGALPIVTLRHQRPRHTLKMIESDKVVQAHAMPDVEQCDLLNLDALRRICDRHQIDTIFHLAASAIVSDAANSPYSTIENNVLGTLNVLEAARINKIPRVLVASSDKSYGDHAGDSREGLPYHEDYSLRGLDVYSASKVCTDMLTQTYSYQFKVPALVVRSCNIFGPGDFNFSRLIPKTIMCLLDGKPPKINQGNENVLREYIYVKDVVRAYMMLMENIADYYGNQNENMPRQGRETFGWAAFNVGSYIEADLSVPRNCERIKSVTDIIDMLRERISDIEPIVKEKPANFIEIPDQYLDSSKIKTIGFTPEYSFAEGLEQSIEWYKKHYDYLKKIAIKHVNS